MEEFHIFFFPDCIHTFSHTPGSEEQASRSPGRGQLIGYDPCQALAFMSAHIGHHSSAHADTSLLLLAKERAHWDPHHSPPRNCSRVLTLVNLHYKFTTPPDTTLLYFLFSSVCLKSQTEQEQASMSPSSDLLFQDKPVYLLSMYVDVSLKSFGPNFI